MGDNYSSIPQLYQWINTLIKLEHVWVITSHIQIGVITYAYAGLSWTISAKRTPSTKYSPFPKFSNYQENSGYLLNNTAVFIGIFAPPLLQWLQCERNWADKNSAISYIAIFIIPYT